MRLLQELYMGFIFQDPSECNISVVREFYANWKPDALSHFVTVRGMEVPLTPSAINQILGIADASFDVLTGINISPPCQQIRHALCGGAVYCEMDLAWVPWLSPVISLCSHELGSSGVVKNCLELFDTTTAFYQGDERSKTKGPENMHGPTLT
ncbi:hypothetical protein KY290_012947 [Solanum tuberosum]|uniref:Putative plant transposon protein domain-containing protein n=1 Tax=Solanum tuberosum TaxID=4113 RepID=A0ABQ7VKA8_SOLTU|nr:hypothetical protein KY290_012947 [Solanum tuberosum]